MSTVIAEPTGLGGARPGSGRPSKAKIAAQVAADKEKPPISSGTLQGYAQSRARVEAAKAESAELHLRIKLGEYVSRESVRAATAMAYSMFAQRMRSLPDDIERRYNLPPEAIQAISDAHDEALTALAKSFELMGGGG
jgi:phage terminase Nu1 subunit (DNA packaging protein)